MLQGRVNAFGQPRADLVRCDESVDHDVDIVALVAVQLRGTAEGNDFAVDASADEPLFEQFVEEVPVVSLLASDSRRQDQEPCSGRELEDPTEHGFTGLSGDGNAARWAVKLADSSEEDTEKVVDLRNGADGGARVRAGALLGDGDRRAEACDAIGFGFGKLAEELARERRKGFHVSPLAFGIECVERE